MRSNRSTKTYREGGKWHAGGQHPQTSKQREEDIHMIKRLLLGAAVVAVTVIAIRSAPDVMRYLKIRAM